MNATTKASRNTPVGSPSVIRENLHQVRDSIITSESSWERLRTKQSEYLGTALDNGATVKEVVDAAGLSRAYLHRPGQPLASSNTASRTSNRATADDERSATREQALARSKKIRDQVRALKTELSTAKTARAELVAQLLEVEADQTVIAQDAGVSAEWIRRLGKVRRQQK